jgi:hypothetical protein
MEIKINCNESSNINDGGRTLIFDGSNIIHQFKHYQNIDDFKKNYGNLTQGKDGVVVGVPSFFWNDIKDDEDVPGEFLLINYHDELGDFKFIVVKYSTVFITNKGQTIDKIMVS